MGAGIAQVAAAAGHPVLLADADPAAVQRARATMEKALAGLVEKGKMEAAARDALLARISWSAESVRDTVSGFAGAALVIEAIVEDRAIKQELFTRLAAVNATGVIATNTSSLSVASLASVVSTPERVIGIHFFNPAPVMPLVEIIPWLGTDSLVTANVRATIDRWGKTTVLAADTPGFIVNRVARPFYGEAIRIAEEGIADYATIDWAMRTIGGFRMGPFELMDFIGNDVNFAVTQSVFAAFFYDPRYRPSLTQQRLVESRFLGRKSGRGYYDYRPGIERPAAREDGALGARIAERIVAMLVNEAVEAVHLRIASPADLDLAMTKGVNYPKGLLAWGDEIGLDRVLATLDALRAEYGEERYRASPLLRRMARDGARFS
ncbi:MAG: 3-hydroxybutyryl-CoA dehydrogenase [Gemmatimonadaceae bacterium]|nr:3-hydroxybutyryl-CoA dehydrogenase [Gemmatimonadaceae bacterium]